MIVKFEVPRPPSINRLWRRGRGKGLYRSKEYTDWITQAHAVFSLERVKTITSFYKLTVLAKKPDKRKRDIDNISSKAVNDALQSGGVVADDCQCQWLEAKWVEEGPPFLIIVETLDEGYDNS